MQSNQDLLQGNLIANDNPVISIPSGYAAVLSSPYGIEGVFTDEDIIRLRIEQLRDLGAYRNEDFAVLLHKINAVA